MSETEILLDEKQAYQAMYDFILAYWKRGGSSSDDLAVLLNNMQIKKGHTNDPAFWDDWIEVLQRTTAAQ